MLFVDCQVKASWTRCKYSVLCNVLGLQLVRRFCCGHCAGSQEKFMKILISELHRSTCSKFLLAASVVDTVQEIYAAGNVNQWNCENHLLRELCVLNSAHAVAWYKGSQAFQIKGSSVLQC